LFPYIANKLINNPCNKEQEAIERACKPEHKQSDTQKDLRKHSKVGELLKKVRMPGKSKKREKGWHWTDDHCDGLQVALVDPADAMAYMKKMEEIGKKLPSELEALAKIRPMLVDLAVNAGTEAAAKWAAKAAAKQLAGSSVPAWGNAVMAIWSVVDGVMAIGDVAEIKAVASAALSQLDVLKSKIDNLQALAKRFEGFSSLDKKAQEAEALALATDAQDALATLNPCVRARKCNLVPHTQNENSRNVEPADSGGCCDGQTGHHLVSGAAMEEACRTNYKHPTAPTVCVEGTSWHKGSHKRAHVAYAKETDDAPKDKDGRMSMEDTMNAAAESHKRAFPLSACDKDCIMAQLRAYYGAKCAAAKPYAANDQGKLVIPQIGTVNR
jgi:hypothetical protein